MADTPVTRYLQDIYMAGHIRTDLGSRIVERIAYAGLRRQMDDPIEIGIRQCRVHNSVVTNIGFVNSDPVAAHPHEFGHARFFQGGGVIVVEIIDAYYCFITFKEPRRCMHANEAGNAGDQDAHSDPFYGSNGLT